MRKKQLYYAIVRKDRKAEYQLITIEGTSVLKIRQQLQHDYLVLVVLGYNKLKELIETPTSNWTNYHYNFSEQAKLFIKNIDINMLETDIKP